MTVSRSQPSSELLPCPFCTSETVQCCFGLGATYLVECQSCETSGPRAMDRATAIDAWNKRPEEAEWKQAASVEAGLRREFAARITELEGALLQTRTALEEVRDEVKLRIPRRLSAHKYVTGELDKIIAALNPKAGS